MAMTHVSLFSGIGGFDLAAEWAGFETALQVENDPYALQVLDKHWPDVPRITDIREVTSESVREPVTVLSGGFPCQPFSQAGLRRGASDDRYLWPEMLRVIRELCPAWVVGENVSGLLSIDAGMEIDRIVASLETTGYEAWILHYPAAGVGAPHGRDRVFIIAHANNDRHGEPFQPQRQRGGDEQANTRGDGKVRTMASGGAWEQNQPRPQRFGQLRESAGEWLAWQGGEPFNGVWQSEPPVDRVAHGVPHRVDRLRALGNAVVPQQAYPIFAAIAEGENEDR
jgi:DNA (cytosine-5)-methyltransferase 1